MMGISNDYFSKEKEKQNKMSLNWTHKNNRICEIEREASFPLCVVLRHFPNRFLLLSTSF